MVSIKYKPQRTKLINEGPDNFIRKRKSRIHVLFDLTLSHKQTANTSSVQFPKMFASAGCMTLFFGFSLKLK
jgi:hypothetical protein